MYTFRQFFLIETPDFASFKVDGIRYNFKIDGSNSEREVCFTLLNTGEAITSDTVDKKQLSKAIEYIDLIVPDTSLTKKWKNHTVHTHIELRAIHIVSKYTIKNSKDFFKQWENLQEKIESEGRAWQKAGMWFVSLHGYNETINFLQLFNILDTYEIYLETRTGTKYINKESFLPKTTPLQQKSPELRRRIEALRHRLHIAVGQEKKAIKSLLDYFDK